MGRKNTKTFKQTSGPWQVNCTGYKVWNIGKHTVQMGRSFYTVRQRIISTHLWVIFGDFYSTLNTLDNLKTLLWREVNVSKWVFHDTGDLTTCKFTNSDVPYTYVGHYRVQQIGAHLQGVGDGLGPAVVDNTIQFIEGLNLFHELKYNQWIIILHRCALDSLSIQCCMYKFIFSN